MALQFLLTTQSTISFAGCLPNVLPSSDLFHPRTSRRFSISWPVPPSSLSTVPHYYTFPSSWPFSCPFTTSQRGSELKVLSVDDGYMRWEPHGVCLVLALDFLTKNQSASFHPPEIFVPDITMHSDPTDDKFWCPVRTLKWYLARTKELRGATYQLFINTVRPHHAVSRDTIARWIVSAIKFASVNWPSPQITRRSAV